MIDCHEDQAAGLRRLFRRAPPKVVALYAAGRARAAIAVRAAYRVARLAERVLILDEAGASDGLAATLGLAEGHDLLAVLGEHVHVPELLQPVPGLVGRVPVRAAALALPLLDEERRLALVAALAELHRRAGFVLVHAATDAAADPSPFVFAAPRRMLVAEVSRTGALEAYALIKALAAAGAGSLHVAVADAPTRAEAAAFFDSLDALVRRHVGVPLAWLGEIERDDLAGGLAAEPALSSPREPEMAFLRRLAALGSAHANGAPGSRAA
ncbi:flagellar FleN [Pseudazoarcus pumilus]|uniref:Flagellar FleN n=1 Tax=Pseudazoarcus pumilus TaxID=2067960 RepID=A0A2I6S8I0_9RHOO|nr:flagellar FleN [Pseudazoarcus pumilus]AUN95565.1 flagellar FleN [Pseudazoarcus pumilus]